MGNTNKDAPALPLPPSSNVVLIKPPVSPPPTTPLTAGSNFEKALAIVLKHEGGYGNDPNDSGGPTNFGITQHDLAVHRGHPVTAADVENMTVAEAGAIYLDTYWKPYLLDYILSFKVSAIIFDQGVLSGTHTAVKLAQQAVGVNPDGLMGAITIGAINAAAPTALANKILDLCAQHYKDIASSVPKDQVFLKGWENRVDSLRSFVNA